MSILWVCDVHGWAYEILAQRYSGLLPQHSHEFAYVAEDWGAARAVIERPHDVVVCFSPRYLRFFPDKQNVLLRLDGHRAFD